MDFVELQINEMRTLAAMGWEIMTHLPNTHNLTSVIPNCLDLKFQSRTAQNWLHRMKPFMLLALVSCQDKEKKRTGLKGEYHEKEEAFGNLCTSTVFGKTKNKNTKSSSALNHPCCSMCVCT
jgi:hypothetical protein